MIEVATFRAAVPEPTDGLDGDLLITDDNEYGSPLEDAQRRDFTINGLFLTLITDSRGHFEKPTVFGIDPVVQ